MALLREHLDSVEKALELSPRDFREMLGLSPDQALAAVKALREGVGEEEAEHAQRLGIRVLDWEDPSYPDMLREIPLAPAVLYVRGSLGLGKEKGFAVVGARRPSDYGQRMAEKLARGLAEAGVVVVSGLARGIDALAHWGAIQRGGASWAVLGSGLDRIYPPENRDLADRLAECGCLVSEFSLGSPPLRDHFPRRNRLISGLSMGVVVVEAGPKSGALITAKWALEQGRSVFAVPGRVGDPNAIGPNSLLRDGAEMAESAWDLLQEFGLKPKGKDRDGLLSPGTRLSGAERTVWEAIGEDGAILEELICKTGLPAHLLSTTLLRLELGGWLEARPGKVFLKKGG
jgi:DNA processing protein